MFNMIKQNIIENESREWAYCFFSKAKKSGHWVGQRSKRTRQQPSSFGYLINTGERRRRRSRGKGAEEKGQREERDREKGG
jgi:hypothetical protein